MDLANSLQLIYFLLSVDKGLHTFSGEQVVFPMEYFSHQEQGILECSPFDDLRIKKSGLVGLLEL